MSLCLLVFLTKNVLLVCSLLKLLSNRYFVNIRTMLAVLVSDHKKLSSTYTNDQETND